MGERRSPFTPQALYSGRQLVPGLRLYFDTNIYNFINAADERQQTEEFIRSHGHTVVASVTNMVEVLANPTDSDREQAVRTIRTVATALSEKPQGYLEAEEFVSEVRRLRPGWLAARPDISRIDVHLNNRRRAWLHAKLAPGVRPRGYSDFHSISEPAISELADMQKRLRQVLLGKPEAELHLGAPSYPELAQAAAGYESTEVYWRLECFYVWRSALRGRHPASSDLMDWAGPYLKADCLSGPDYARFWIVDVAPDRMPRNRLRSLAHYYQLFRKVRRSNVDDAAHALYLLDVDALLTADKDLHQVLVDLRRHFPDSAVPILLNRGASSIVAELATALEDWSS